MGEHSTILHVDMDAFFASVSELDYPQYKGKPLVVGAGARGVVLSANYAARKFGIKAAMPVSRAQRMAPNAIFIPPDHERYSQVSRKVMEIFFEFTPHVEPLSLDEAFLDVTGSRKLFGSGRNIAELIRKRVFASEKITCSVGIATTKFIAKLASGRCKPNGILEIAHDRVLTFLHPLPVSEIWGVGPKTNEELQALGLRTVADIANTPLETLKRALGASAGESLYELAWARDYREVVADAPEKSISAAETFAYDLEDQDEIFRELLRLTERAGARLRARSLRSKTIGLKVRFSDFTNLTRSKTLPLSISGSHEIYEVAKELYLSLKINGSRIRLLGVSLEQLVDQSGAVEQLELGEREVGWSQAQVAIDRAIARFGSGSVKPARLIGEGDDESQDS
ncbi:MAG: DNA polymerase IV [Actinobacteria bacterium]|nr:DNA polymerase IV [Actinomycetota bacterium]NBO07319.1 DNA polymerase IV [Actinomycetota bacterium]NBO47434.1 DNA polymerase IV [Actinomycetota bacterium]NBP22436.1 DNA polymerase IV [Actinomycetota bacterium]NBQ01062.1 DNA polymerase IV [Actinomycetota bacterium]